MGVDVIKMPFLATKLYTTPPRPDLVDRLRLIAQLDQGLRMGHSFRHAFARDFLMDGGDLGSLADLLGHSSVLVTKEFYGVFTMQELQEKHAQHSPVAQLFERGGQDGDETGSQVSKDTIASSSAL